MGTSSEGGNALLIGMIPLLWISKLRQIRLLVKIIGNTFLMVLPKMDILMPLFPVTWQVIAKESYRWYQEADGVDDVNEESESSENKDDTDGDSGNDTDDEDEEDEEEEEELETEISEEDAVGEEEDSDFDGANELDETELDENVMIMMKRVMMMILSI